MHNAFNFIAFNLPVHTGIFDQETETRLAGRRIRDNLEIGWNQRMIRTENKLLILRNGRESDNFSRLSTAGNKTCWIGSLKSLRYRNVWVIRKFHNSRLEYPHWILPAQFGNNLLQFP